MVHTFKRKLYSKLQHWKETEQGRTAILVEGARRVGKSTLVEQFAKQEYRSYILIDFNKTSQEVKKLFDDLMDLNRIFLQLQNIYHTVLYPRESVIVFDEVQQCPKARQAIKYLVADGRYDYIETGSLISIKNNISHITIPSEEQKLQLNPLDYEEFRWALNDEVSIPILKQFFDSKIGTEQAHRKNMADMRLYMLVGGMPQAVDTYLTTNNLMMVDNIKRNIISLYLDDFRKIDKSGRLEKLYKNIPAQLAANSSRFKPFQIVGQVNNDTFVEMMHNLEDSKTVNISYNCTDPNVGLPQTIDLSRYKLFTSDIGLFITLCYWDKDYTENIIYSKLLSDKISANLGYIYENLIAQMLVASGYRLFYHTWAKDENHNYEIDFLLSQGAKISPIEVKSSGYATHASLDAFCAKYSSRILRRYMLYTKDLKRDHETLMLPVYMTPFL